MNSFLKKLKNSLTYDKPVSIIMGNEAADLDSMVSAITYAWYLNLNDTSKNPYPLINIPKADFKLRTEAVYLFKEAVIDINDLLFAEDIDLKKLKDKGNLNLILVDHNKLASNQVTLENSIIEILDHHADEKSYPSNTITDIRPVGSASTIVSELFLKNQSEHINNKLGILLLGTILLDTVNLDPAAERVTEADSKAAEKIIKITGLDKEKLFEKLQFEKFNVSSLGTYDLLRKDYKEWQLGAVKCGIGAVLQAIETWIEKDPNISKECERYLKEKNLNVLFAMNAFTAPEFTRQLVVYIPDEKLKNKTLNFLESSDLGLEKIESTSLKTQKTLRFYNQKNLGISRKKLQPILKTFFEELS